MVSLADLLLWIWHIECLPPAFFCYIQSVSFLCNSKYLSVCLSLFSLRETVCCLSVCLVCLSLFFCMRERLALWCFTSACKPILHGKQHNSVQFCFISPLLSLQKLQFMHTLFWLCPLEVHAHSLLTALWNLKLGNATAHLDAESFWWWQCSVKYSRHLPSTSWYFGPAGVSQETPWR